MINYKKQTYGTSCASFYTDQLGIAAAQAADLCDSTKSVNFTFSDPLLSAAALTNVYLYQGQYNSWYFTEFMSLSGVDPATINTTLYGANSKWETLFNTI